MPSWDYRIRNHNACQARVAPRDWEAVDDLPFLMRALFECRLEHIGRYAFNGLPSNTRIIDLKRHRGAMAAARKGTLISLSYGGAAPARSRRNERRSRRIATRLE